MNAWTIHAREQMGSSSGASRAGAETHPHPGTIKFDSRWPARIGMLHIFATSLLFVPILLFFLMRKGGE